MSHRSVTSWGRAHRSPQRLLGLASSHAGLPLDDGQGSLLAYGNGRSYGDSNLNSAGALLNGRQLDRFIHFDAATGVLRCEAGVLLSEVLRLVVPQGWFLPVTPGTQFVTVGGAISTATQELFEKNAYRDYLELHGLSVQLTEALAEYWHTRIRSELGFSGQDPAELEAFFKLGYRGARFSLGYGACPDLEDRAKIVQLLEPERVGVTLSEEFQLVPEQATDAIVIHHPEAKYFNV